MTNTKRRIFEGPDPSIEFLNSLGHGGGGTEVTCSWCGRSHYAIDNDSMTGCWDDIGEEEPNDGMRVETLALIANDPDGHIPHYDCDSVYYYQLDEQVFPENCPCNGLRRYENFMWANRVIFKKYMDSMKLKLENDLASIANITLPIGEQ